MKIMITILIIILIAVVVKAMAKESEDPYFFLKPQTPISMPFPLDKSGYKIDTHFWIVPRKEKKYFGVFTNTATLGQSRHAITLSYIRKDDDIYANFLKEQSNGFFKIKVTRSDNGSVVVIFDEIIKSFNDQSINHSNYTVAIFNSVPGLYHLEAEVLNGASKLDLNRINFTLSVSRSYSGK